MKKITVLFLYVLIFASVLLQVSCDTTFGPTWEYLVDNPLDTEIVIRIDGQEYTIPARTTQAVPLSQGRHILTYDGSSADFVTKVNSNKSVTILNPTLSNYMLHGHFYISDKSRNDNIDYIYEQNSYEYSSDEGTVKLPVRVLNTLFIQKAHTPWAFGLDQGARPEVSVNSPEKKIVFHKLYREEEYLKDFADELPSGIVFPDNPGKLSEQPPYVFPTESLLCDCEGANEAIRGLEERWKKIIAEPSDIFQAVGRLSFDAITTTRQEMLQKCSTQFNPGRDDTAFQEMLSRLHREMSYLTDANTFIVK